MQHRSPRANRPPGRSPREGEYLKQFKMPPGQVVPTLPYKKEGAGDYTISGDDRPEGKQVSHKEL